MDAGAADHHGATNVRRAADRDTRTDLDARAHLDTGTITGSYALTHARAILGSPGRY